MPVRRGARSCDDAGMAWTWWTRAVHAMGIAALGALVAACATGTAPRTGRDGSVDPGIDAQVLPGIDAQVEPGVDAYVPPGTDAHVPDVDAYVPPAPDAGPVVGRGAYLDRCTADTDCASGRCVDDHGSTRFCSRACASDLECAHEHLCSAAGVCVHDDTGAPCSIATPATCADGACLGTAGGASCTRDCASAAECPAGYACTTVDTSGRRVCVDIERPCTAAAECATGLCFGGVGCTAECRTAADCPARLAALGVPPYRCSTELGTANPICIPPSDVVGSDPIGAACRYNASGIVQCRSGACDDSAPLGPMCVQ